MKITRKQLESLPKDELIAIAREAQRIKENARYRTLESYWETAHEAQIDFCKAAKTHRIRYFIGGNRTGKSTAGFVEDILIATGRHPYLKSLKTPNKGVVIVQDFENAAKNILEVKINEWCPKGEIDKFDRNQIGAIRKIYFKNGSTIDVLSHDQDIKVFEGSDYDYAHFDEPPPRKIYTAVWRGLTDRGGMMYITATPLSSPWMYQEWIKGMSGDNLRWFRFVKMSENAKNLGDGNEELGKKRIQQFAELLDEDEKEARLNGEFAQIRGLVFKDFDKKHHMISPFPIPAEWMIWESIDPHPQKDWAVSWIAITDNDKKVLLRSQYMSGDIEEIANQILHGRSLLPIRGGNRPRIVRCIIDNYASVPLWQKSNTDPTTDRISVRQELENYIGPSQGCPPIEVAPKNVAHKIELFKTWLKINTNEKGSPESHFYVFDTPENQDFVFEIENYVWDTGKNKLLKDKPKKEDDDILDTIMQIALVLPKVTSNVEPERFKIMENKSWRVGR